MAPGTAQDQVRPRRSWATTSAGAVRTTTQTAEVDLTHGVGALPDVVERGAELPPVPRPRRPLERGAQLPGRDEPLLDACRQDPHAGRGWANVLAASTNAGAQRCRARPGTASTPAQSPA